MQDQALNGLQQRIMQFPRNALALVVPFLQTQADMGRHRAHPRMIGQPQHQQHASRAKQLEWPVLHEAGADGDMQHAFRPPAGVAPRRLHMEAVIARRQIGVGGGAAVLGLHPVVLDALQPETEAQGFGRRIAGADIGEADRRTARRQDGRLGIAQHDIACFQSADLHRWRRLGRGQGARVEHGHAAGRGQPQPPVAPASA
jgi:hypothetical protein